MPKFARKKQAFSLVELAIVMIIVGILVAAALQATNMIRSFKLLGARAQTKSSAINGIQGIVGWYDSTSERSFNKSETIDGAKVSTWNDINSQATIGNNATQNVFDNAKPTYVFDPSVANGLPILRFDGNDYFDLPDSTLPESDYNYTFFFAIRTTSTSESYGILGSGDFMTKNASNIINYRAGGFIENNWQLNTLLTHHIVISAGKMQVLTFNYDNAVGRKIYVNGNLAAQDSEVGRAGIATNNAIGKTTTFGIPDMYMKGDIAEIILFGRSLSKEERQAVEKYLSKKWTITL